MNSILLLFLHYIIVTNAFNPLSISIFGSSTSATHEAITRCAVATVTNEYIQTRFGIQITAPTVTNGICPASFFSQLKTIFPQIKSQTGKTYFDWKNTLNHIVASNTLVDVTEQTDTSRHFDSESFIPASKIILERYQLAIKALNSSDFEGANDYFGKLTHTLQDFYAHSNWIELNQRQPQPDLGIKQMTATQFAGSTVRTCTNCASGSTVVCQSNTAITKDLTSGYFLLLGDIFNKKPVGKCSHGGTLDGTKDSDAIGGINKDTQESIHGYLHQPAAQTAYLATCKVLRQFRAQVTDPVFGQFLNILPRQKFFRRLFPMSISTAVHLDPALVHTTILNNLRKAESFSLLQQVVSLPAIDSYYKAHILSIAAAKHVIIDIFRHSLFRQSHSDFGQNLAKSTGGLYPFYHNQSQANISTNTKKQTELIHLLYSKQTSDDISITIDRTCSSLLLELITNETIPSLMIQLKNSQQTLTPSSIVTNTPYYQSYFFCNISSGVWKLKFVSSINFTFDLRVSCSSEFRCFSRLYVNNDNPVHPGIVALEGNLIENQNAFVLTTCDDKKIPIQNLMVSMIDEMNGKPLEKSFQSIHDLQNDRWITNLTNIPSRSFRLQFSMNNQEIQRLSPTVYQPSLINVKIYQIDTTLTNNTVIKYRLYNYHRKAVRIDFIAKNIGTYMEKKMYLLEGNATREDQIEFDQNTKAVDMTGNMLALTISTSGSDWNYDIISL